MKRTIATLTVVATLALTGCGTPTQSSSGNGFLMRESTYTLKDGRTITCLIYDHNSIDCDWEGAQ